MQRVIIFGASGKTGQLLAEQALEASHHVTAFVRRANAFPMSHARLRVVIGDVRNDEAVSAAIAGQDVVLSALGPTQKNDPLCEDATRCILAGMQAHGVQRLISLSAYGASESRTHDLYSKMVWMAVGSKMRDKERMETLIRSSPVDWTLVRPPGLTDGPRTGVYRTGSDVPVGVLARLSRADVAEFMLREAVEKKYVREAPTINAGRGAAR